MRINREVNRNKIVIAVVSLVLLAAVGVAGFFAKQYFDLRASSGQEAQADAKTIADKVSKLIKLPTDDTPVVGEIKDKSKLKDQPFFANAENGDQLLIYQKTRKAYIYREKDNILVNVDSVNIPEANKATDETKK